MINRPAYITSPIGIDKPIQKLQKHLLSKVSWLTTGANPYNFGRVYRNETKDGIVPEVYDSNNEYINILPDDNVNGMCFFDVPNDIELVNRSANTSINIVFFINLEKSFPNVANRADENAINDIIQNCERYGFELQSVIKGTKVFDAFNYSRKYLDDMQPYFIFAIECDLNYEYNVTGC